MIAQVIGANEQAPNEHGFVIRNWLVQWGELAENARLALHFVGLRSVWLWIGG